MRESEATASEDSNSPLLRSNSFSWQYYKPTNMSSEWIDDFDEPDGGLSYKRLQRRKEKVC